MSRAGPSGRRALHRGLLRPPALLPRLRQLALHNGHVTGMPPPLRSRGGELGRGRRRDAGRRTRPLGGREPRRFEKCRRAADIALGSPHGKGKAASDPLTALPSTGDHPTGEGIAEEAAVRRRACSAGGRAVRSILEWLAPLVHGRRPRPRGWPCGASPLGASQLVPQRQVSPRRWAGGDHGARSTSLVPRRTAAPRRWAGIRDSERGRHLVAERRSAADTRSAPDPPPRPSAPHERPRRLGAHPSDSASHSLSEPREPLPGPRSGATASDGTPRDELLALPFPLRGGIFSSVACSFQCS